jgi:hypothetical protein
VPLPAGMVLLVWRQCSRRRCPPRVRTPPVCRPIARLNDTVGSRLHSPGTRDCRLRQRSRACAADRPADRGDAESCEVNANFGAASGEHISMCARCQGFAPIRPHARELCEGCEEDAADDALGVD